MQETVIRVENISKQYRLGVVGTGTIVHDLNRWLAKVRGKEDPFLKIGDENKIDALEGEYIWALKNINFEVKQGEIFGIIGKNGAGKSTLLKILSKVTAPTVGIIKVKGKIASLLEVGTGFNPELTGRENIFLNGAILGMTKQEIKNKYDDIVDFSGVEKYIDTPVKRYSSGMYVRLAFAVAAHLEPDILVLDEVLAVGDAEFQKKCLGKMEDVASEGRTILYVSHNLASVEHLCSRAILLEEGQLVLDDKVTSTIARYLQKNSFSSNNGLAYAVNRDLLKKCYHPDIQIANIALLSLSGEPLNVFRTGDPLLLRIHYEAKRQFVSQAFAVHINNHFGQRIVQLNTTPISGYPITHLAHKGYIDLVIESLPLTAGRYYFDVGFFKERREWIIKLEEVIALDIEIKDVYGSGMALDNSRGVMVVAHYWMHCSEGTSEEASPVVDQKDL